MAQSSDTADTTPKANPARRLVLATVPLAVAAVIGLFLYRGLSLDPGQIPSALIDKPAPDFSLPAVQGRELGLGTEDLKGQVSLVNVFASWCVACRAEHPLLTELGRQGVVAIHGLNYKDRPQDAAEWLDRYGDPYTRTGADIDGRVGIEFGVYGVPETFVVDKNGVIVEKIIGPVTPHILKEKLLPLIADLKR